MNDGDLRTIHEDEQAEASMIELGASGFRIFKGARRAGASWWEAVSVLVAWYIAVAKWGRADED